MKQYQVLVSNWAQESIKHIVALRTESVSDQSADKLELELLRAIESLKTFPDRHGKLKIKRKKGGNPYRFLPQNRYKIIYTVEEQPDAIVIIIELVHDRMSMPVLESILP